MQNTNGSQPVSAGLSGLVPGLVRFAWPTRTETGPYTGPLSTLAEFHALGVGYALGPRFQEVAADLLTDSESGNRPQSDHLADAVDELAYAGLGVGLRYVAGEV